MLYCPDDEYDCDEGEWACLLGQDAVDYAVTYWSDYGITEEWVYSNIGEDRSSLYQISNFCCIEMHIQSHYSAAEEKEYEKDEMRYFVGFYADGGMNLLDIETNEQYWCESAVGN